MKIFNTAGMALIVLASPIFPALADEYNAPMPINMSEMQKVQAEYENLKKQKEQERKAITDNIAAEELAKSKKEQAATGSFSDPYAVAEMRTKARTQALTTEWKKEDRELEVQMHNKMMQKSGMGNMLKMQQEMMKSYGYTAPPAR